MHKQFPVCAGVHAYVSPSCGYCIRREHAEALGFITHVLLWFFLDAVPIYFGVMLQLYCIVLFANLIISFPYLQHIFLYKLNESEVILTWIWKSWWLVTKGLIEFRSHILHTVDYLTSDNLILIGKMSSTASDYQSGR